MNGIKHPPAAELLGSGLVYDCCVVWLTGNFLVCAFFSGLRNQRMLKAEKGAHGGSIVGEAPHQHGRARRAESIVLKV